MNSKQPFNVMVKPVGGECNLGCRYCYYLAKTGLYPGAPRLRMEEPVLAAFTGQYLAAQPPGEVLFSWQGGEPLLAGIDFFRRAFALQEELAPAGKKPANVLQTNGTLVDQEWADLFSRHKVLVGLSLDGPREVHDRNRVDLSGKGSFERAWQGLELLRERNVEFNLLVTLNRDTVELGGDLYRWFRDQGIKWLQFIPVLERDDQGRPREFSCPPAAYGRFLRETFDLWHEQDLGRVSVRLFESILFSLVKGRASLCCFTPRCADAHVLEWNGDLYACDHFVEREWLLGNIMEEPLEELRQGQRLKQFAALKTGLPAECGECPYRGLCWGGCPKHRLPGPDGRLHNQYCSAYKELYEHAGDRLTALADALAAEEAPAPRLHRNDPCPCGSGRKFKRCCGR